MRIGQNLEGLTVIVFKLGGEEYGVDAMNVQEALRCQHLTPIPDAPAAIVGSLTFQDKCVPVMDLRQHLPRCRQGFDNFTIILILRAGEDYVGIISDDVTGVTDVSAVPLQPASSDAIRDCLFGSVFTGERTIHLVDPGKLLSLCGVTSQIIPDQLPVCVVDGNAQLSEPVVAAMLAP